MNNVLQSKPLLIAASAVLVMFVLIGLLWGSLALAEHQNKGVIVSGVVVGSVPVGGLTRVQAYEAVARAVNAFEDKGILFEAGQQSVVLKPEVISQAGPGSSYVMFAYDIEKSVDAAYGITRDGGLMGRALERFHVARKQYVVPLDVRIDDAAVKRFLVGHFSGQETPLQETGFNISFAGEQLREVDVESGSPGRVLHYDRAIADAQESLRYLRSGSIVLSYELQEPRVSHEQARSLVSDVRGLLSQEELVLTFKEDQWRVPRSRFSEWIGVEKVDGRPVLKLRESVVQAYLDSIAADFEVEAQSAKFEIGDEGRVQVFEASRDGLVIDREKTMQQIADGFLDNGLATLAIAVKVAPAEVSTADVNEFGIQELIAEGRTDFSGSPANRRHNIARGISLINGHLIKPGEEFSTLAALGNIDEAHGFRAELVIKGNETTPEAGGGLCQVSTTLFRATLNAGLPITARRNHSYRVSYYEPPVGKDATIYDPAPDYKFLNDTGHYVLIQGWVEGNEAVFQFWGVKDGREVIQTEPEVYNFVPPPPSKRILTTDLPAGKVKCTERAHTGASAHFDYIVTYPDGEQKEERFSSVYRPWGEVCLVGATQEEIAEQEALEILKAEQEALISPEESQ